MKTRSYNEIVRLKELIRKLISDSRTLSYHSWTLEGNGGQDLCFLKSASARASRSDGGNALYGKGQN